MFLFVALAQTLDDHDYLDLSESFCGIVSAYAVMSLALETRQVCKPAGPFCRWWLEFLGCEVQFGMKMDWVAC